MYFGYVHSSAERFFLFCFRYTHCAHIFYSKQVYVLSFCNKQMFFNSLNHIRLFVIFLLVFDLIYKFSMTIDHDFKHFVISIRILFCFVFDKYSTVYHLYIYIYKQHSFNDTSHIFVVYLSVVYAMKSSIPFRVDTSLFPQT